MTELGKPHQLIKKVEHPYKVIYLSNKNNIFIVKIERDIEIIDKLFSVTLYVNESQ